MSAAGVAPFDVCKAFRAADGARIAYSVAGPASTSTSTATSSSVALLLIHGLASNRSRFAEFVDHTALRAERTVIRVDLRGHGDSVGNASDNTRGDTQNHAPGRIESWCADLDALLTHVGASRAVVVGHSLGAQVALHFAARFSERVSALVLIDPVFPEALKGTLAWYARFGWAFRCAVGLARFGNSLGLGRRDPLPPRDLRALDEQAREALKSPASQAAFVAQYSSTWADLRHIHLAQYLQDLIELFRPLPRLEALSMPVLLLMSSGATFAHAIRTARVIARFPNATVQPIECQHWPLTERPAEVREAIERWTQAAV